jgi:hypothetical protein
MLVMDFLGSFFERDCGGWEGVSIIGTAVCLLAAMKTGLRARSEGAK